MLNLKEFLLTKLSEECSEVIHDTSKTIIYGFEGYVPTDIYKETNRNRIHRELSDIVAVVELLNETSHFDFSIEDHRKHIDNKKQDLLALISKLKENHNMLP